MRFQVTLIPRQHQFTVETGQTVLDAGLRAGLMLPYSCRGGACSTCKGKVVAGLYEAGSSPAQTLTSAELAAGYTLLCQACPRSDLIVEPTALQLANDIQIRQYLVRVQTIDRLAPEVVGLRLQLPATASFHFHAGQYIEFILKDGRRRPYSMASPPHAGGPLELHIRHMPGGYFTDYIFGAAAAPLKVRDILRMEGPYGSFFLREAAKPILFLVTGTGFAPIQAMVEHMLYKRIQRPVSIYWGGRRPWDLYRDQLAASWAATLPYFNYVPVLSEALPEDGWHGRQGFVHEAIMQDLPDLSAYQVYACGAPAMVAAARHALITQCGLPAEEFYADAFTSARDLVTAST